MSVSVVIVTHNSSTWIAGCLESIKSQPLQPELTIVDNGSRDNTLQLVRTISPHAKVVTQANLGFGAGCNRGVREARGDILVFVNPDTVPLPRWLDTLIEGLGPGRIHTSQIMHLERPNRIQTLGLDLHYSGIATLRREGEPAPLEGPPEEVAGFSGAAFAMMRADFERLGGFDEGFFLYMEDVDLAWRARRQGMTIWGIPASRLLHRLAGRLTPTKLAYIRKGRRRLLHKHLGRSTRLLLAPALGAVSFMEAVATIKIGRAKANGQTSPAKTHALEGRPTWLQSALPSQAFGTSKWARWGAAVLSPLFVLNAALWPRAR